MIIVLMDFIVTQSIRCAHHVLPIVYIAQKEQSVLLVMQHSIMQQRMNAWQHQLQIVLLLQENKRVSNVILTST